MKVHFAESDLWGDLSDNFIKKYEAEVVSAFNDVAGLLENLSEHVNFFITPAPWNTINETGDGGFTRDSRLVIISLDPDTAQGAGSLLKHARSTVFHELNHCARFESGIWHATFIDNCIMEGLATVFERDYGGLIPLWGEYDRTEALKWYEEIVRAGESINSHHYMYSHPDGRRWIGYKTGTFIVDRAVENSDQSVMQLTSKTSEEIIKLAEL